MTKKSNTKFIIGGAIIILVIAIGVFSAQSDKSGETTRNALNTPSKDSSTASDLASKKSVRVGNQARDFTLETIDGETVSLSDFRGKKALVITSTASWCPTCIIEAGEFAPVYPDFKDTVEFLSVSIDPTDDKQKLNQFKSDYNTPWFYTEPNLHGTSQMILDYRFDRFEITYIIDKEGIIRFKDSRITPSKELRKELEKLSGIVDEPIPDLGQAFEIQGRQHIVVGDKHPAYNSNPPTSGWHYDTPADWGAYDKALPDERVIHNLEHGGVWVSYNPSLLQEDQQQFIQHLLSTYSSKVIITPREENDSAIAVASWGRLLTLDAPLDNEKESLIIKFIEQYKDTAPEYFPDNN